MSAIDFDMDIIRKADPKGDRVSLRARRRRSRADHYCEDRVRHHAVLLFACGQSTKARFRVTRWAVEIKSLRILNDRLIHEGRTSPGGIARVPINTDLMKF